MPLYLLVAIFLAFGFDSTSDSEPLSRFELGLRLGKILGGVALIGLAAIALGRVAARRVGQTGPAAAKARRYYFWGVRVLEILALAAYGWTIHWVDWGAVVRDGMGLRGVLVLDEALILAPYVLTQLALWCGLHPAERALRSAVNSHRPPGLGTHLLLRARQTLGLVLPVLLVFTVGQELARRQWPEWSSSPWVQPIEAAAMGLVVLTLAPLFVRLAWPTRRLQTGPLRNRLERLAGRLGFRCTDILVWDTGQVVVNACVTGSLPWFRYVLLTDALIDSLDEHEIAAVFGHEVGHIAHRHLLYFAFFFVGSLGVLTMFGDQLTEFAVLCAGRDRPVLAKIVEAGVALVAIGVYFVVVFGHVSRRFEGQADIYGCQAVSCGAPHCPPHADVDAVARRASAPANLCPVGIRIFANALANVASLNGLEPRARSWRHGSIARRIAFLEGLEGNPEAIRRFELGVSRLRMVVALILIGVMVAGFAVSNRSIRSSFAAWARNPFASPRAGF
jgi:STE24 endopeptidase